MRRARLETFAQREHDALLIATASDADVRNLCQSLGDNSESIASHIRELLSRAASLGPIATQSGTSEPERFPLSRPGMLPLHRILVVDDNRERLERRIAEFRLHQFRLGVVIETASSGQDALARLQSERFEGVLIELESITPADREVIEDLKRCSTPMPPILLNTGGMDVLEVRKLNREAVRAIAVALGKPLPLPYRRKEPAREEGERIPQAKSQSPRRRKTGTR